MCDFKIFNLVGKVNDKLKEEFSIFIADAEKMPNKPVILSINSCSDDIDVALDIYKCIRKLKNPVYTLISGTCGNALGMLPFAVPYMNRFAFEHSKLELQSIDFNIDENTSLETVSKDAEFIEQLNFGICDLISGETNIDDDILIDIFLNNKCKIHAFTTEDFEANKIANIIEKFDDIFS